MDIGAFHESDTDIGVPEAVSRPRLAIPVKLQVGPIQQVIEHADMVPWEQPIGRLRVGPTP